MPKSTSTRLQRTYAKKVKALRERTTATKPKRLVGTNIRKLITANDIDGALDVIRYHIKQKDVRVALYLLDQYFGKPAQQTELSEAPKKPVNLRLTSDFLDKLSQKYFPKPQQND
ncbi:MAG: hypothetical protein L0Y80_00940 [Ignavibacteriae bacterium]|nr:hypothetical protein [Ignavibacteriota bacterium]